MAGKSRAGFATLSRLGLLLLTSLACRDSGSELNLPRFSGHLQRLDQVSRQEVCDEEETGTTVHVW